MKFKFKLFMYVVLYGNSLVFLSCVAPATDIADNEKQGRKLNRVPIPRTPIFATTKQVPALDAAFQPSGELRQIDLQLQFAGLTEEAARRLILHDLVITKGTVTISSKSGQITLLPDGWFKSKPQHDIPEKTLQLQSNDRGLSLTAILKNARGGVLLFGVGSIKALDEQGRVLKDYSYQTLKSTIEKIDNSWRSTLTLEFSSDFEGKIDGWFVWRPK